MKLFALIFTAILLASQTNAGIIEGAMEFVINHPVNYVFRKILGNLAGVVKNGCSVVRIPSLDPYKIGPLNLSINSEDLRANMTALNISSSGLSNYKVIRAEMRGPITQPLTIGVGFQWPIIQGNISSYDIISGRVMDFVNIFGNGDARYKLTDLKFTSEIFLEFKNEMVSIKDMETNVSLGGLEFHTDGLYNDEIISNTMSIVISEIGPEAIETNQKELTDAINNQVMDLVDKLLRKLTAEEILNFIIWKLPKILLSCDVLI